MKRFIELCKDNTLEGKLRRTIFQGIVSALLVAVPQLVGLLALPEWASAFLVALFMSCLSPIMAALGNKGDCNPEGE